MLKGKILQVVLIFLVGISGGIMAFYAMSVFGQRSYSTLTERITEKQVYVENSASIASVKKLSQSLVTILSKDDFEKFRSGQLPRVCFDDQVKCQNLGLILTSDGVILYGGEGQDKIADLVAVDSLGADYQMFLLGKIKGFSVLKLVKNGELLLDQSKRTRLFSLVAVSLGSLNTAEVGQMILSVESSLMQSQRIQAGIIKEKYSNKGLLTFDGGVLPVMARYSVDGGKYFFDLSGGFLSSKGLDGSEISAEEILALLKRMSVNDKSMDIADLGFKCQTLNRKLAQSLNLEIDYGCLVSEGISGSGELIDGGLKKGSLADKAGLKFKDIILEADNNSLLNANLIEIVMNKAKGESLDLSVLRDKKVINLSLKI